MASRSGYGHSPAPAVVHDVARGRIHVTHVNAVVRSGLHCVSVYCVTGEGLSVRNLAIGIEEIASNPTIRANQVTNSGLFGYFNQSAID